MPCDSEGITLSVHQKLQWLIHLWAHSLRKGDEHLSRTGTVDFTLFQTTFDLDMLFKPQLNQLGFAAVNMIWLNVLSVCCCRSGVQWLQNSTVNTWPFRRGKRWYVIVLFITRVPFYYFLCCSMIQWLYSHCFYFLWKHLSVFFILTCYQLQGTHPL